MKFRNELVREFYYREKEQTKRECLQLALEEYESLINININTYEELLESDVLEEVVSSYKSIICSFMGLYNSNSNITNLKDITSIEKLLKQCNNLLYYELDELDELEQLELEQYELELERTQQEICRTIVIIKDNINMEGVEQLRSELALEQAKFYMLQEQVKPHQEAYLREMLNRALATIKRNTKSRKPLFTNEEINNLTIKFEKLTITVGGNFCAINKTITINESYLRGNILISTRNTTLDQEYNKNRNIVNVLIHELAHYYSYLHFNNDEFNNNTNDCNYFRYYGDESLIHMVVLSKFNPNEENSYNNYNHFVKTQTYRILQYMSWNDILKKLHSIVRHMELEYTKLLNNEIYWSYGKTYTIKNIKVKFGHTSLVNYDFSIEEFEVDNNTNTISAIVILPTTFFEYEADNMCELIKECIIDEIRILERYKEEEELEEDLCYKKGLPF